MIFCSSNYLFLEQDQKSEKEQKLRDARRNGFGSDIKGCQFNRSYG